MTKRYSEFDYIRTIAALAVIVIHVTSLYVYQSKFMLVANQFARFAVPIFILISGLLLYLSDSGRNLSNFFTKRIKKICIPFVFWTIFYLIFNNSIDLKSGKGMFLNFFGLVFKGLVYGNAYVHLYFITIILQCYIIYPIIKYLLNRWQCWTLCISFGITLLYQVGIYFMQMGKIGFSWSPLPCYEFLPTWLFYFVLGMFIAKNILKIKEYIQGKSFLLGIIWSTTLLLLLIDSKLTKIYDSIRPSVMLYCITTFFFLYSLLIGQNLQMKKISDFIRWVSLQSFIIYLSHLYFMKLIIDNYPKLVTSTYGNPIFCGMFLFLGTVFSTLLFVFLISKTPLSSILGGVTSKIRV